MLDVGVLVQDHLDLKKRGQYLHVLFAFFRVPAMFDVFGYMIDSKEQYRSQLVDQRKSVIGADHELVEKHANERIPYLPTWRPTVIDEL